VAERPTPYLIVIGGGKVGYYLTKHLLESGYEVTLCEKNRERATALRAHLGAGAILVGDGDEMAFLATTGIERATVVAAVTGEDEDNLIACQLAKRTFHVPRTLARVNSPRNVRLFHQLGVDVAISATDVIMGVIETELTERGDVSEMPLDGGEACIVRVTVPEGAAAGRPAAAVPELAQERILLILRGGREVAPADPLEVGDQVVLFTRRPAAAFTVGALEPATPLAR